MVKNTVLTKGYMITFIWILNLFSKKKTLHVVRMKWSIIIQIDLYILELSNAVPWWLTRSRNFWNEDAMWFTKNAETTEANKTSAIPMHFKNCAKFKATLRLLVSMVTNQRWDAFKVFMIFFVFVSFWVFLELCILCQISKSTNVLNLLWTYLWTSILFHLQNNYAMICLYIFFWWKRKMLSLLLVRHSKVIKEIYSILFTDWNQRYD